MAKGGAARPIKQVTSGAVKAGPAIPVYGYDAPPTDRAAGAGPAIPVKMLTDADLRQNGGAYVVAGDPQPMPVYDAPGGMAVTGDAAQPIYVVGGRLGGGGQSVPYYQKILSLSPIRYRPLWEASGTTITELVKGDNKASGYRNATLGQTGIGDGKTSAQWSGTGWGDIYTASTNTDMNKADGAMGIWFKWPNTGYWTEGVVRFLTRLQADSSNSVGLSKQAANNRLYAEYKAGGTTSGGYAYYMTDAKWYHALINWSKSADKVELWINGVLQATWNSVGTWSGNLTNNVCAVAANDIYADGPWYGNLAHWVLFDRCLTAAEIKNTLFLGVPNTSMLGLIGDSITADSITVLDRWPLVLCNAVTGIWGRANHAVSSQSIVTHMAAQAAACAGDNADKIIMALGTNDNNAGDMGVLQATVEAAIDTVRASNTRARVYYMNVLPCWTDNTGATPSDRGNIRTAIAAACTSKGVTCWDTYSTPWIDAGDTSDGTHPTVDGCAKIVAQVLARL